MLIRFHRIRERDGQTDGRTDGQNCYISTLTRDTKGEGICFGASKKSFDPNVLKTVSCRVTCQLRLNVSSTSFLTTT